MSKIRGYFFKTQVSPDAEPRPSRLWEITHPRQAEALYAQMEGELEMQAAGDIKEREADLAYWQWAEDDHPGDNPPDSRALDEEIDRRARQYPEPEAREYEKVGEPPWGYNGWTFTQWALERGYDREFVEEINREFPPDRAEIEYGARRDLDREYDDYEKGLADYYERSGDAIDLPERQCTSAELEEEDSDRQYMEWAEHADEPGAGNPPKSALLDEAIEEATWAYPESEQQEIRGEPERHRTYPERETPGLLRFVPMKQHEPDPYDPLYLPNYSYWPVAEREAGS